MPYTINDDCINCGVCEAECPVSCIKAGDDKFYIVADECIDCEACVGCCPTDAIVPA